MYLTSDVKQEIFESRGHGKSKIDTGSAES
ncbi:MAG: hypothetical protein RLZZ306_3449, partial [Bacteroidota bacterium]